MDKLSSPVKTVKVCSGFYLEKDLFFYILIHFIYSPSGYPVSVSGMITLPVSSSVYQSMVANIQQIHTNGDGTLCITPMQVQKSGHQSNSINHMNNTSISGSLIGGSNCSVVPCISNVNSSYSNVNSGGTPVLASCHLSSNGLFGTASELTSSLNCDGNANSSNSNHNLLELCRVLSQSTNVSNANCQNTASFNHISQNITNNDRKSSKSKKLAQRNQYFNSHNFNTPTTFSNETNGMDRTFMTQNIDAIKTVHDSDTNNNNHSNENNGDADHDLKCGHVMVSTGMDDSLKANKTDNMSVNIQLGELETRHIKMECEIDVA